jgi:hypothetical protein
MAHSAAVAATTRVPVRALSSKVAAGVSGSKGTASAKKTMMHIRKHCVPTIRAMSAASSEESQESSPHSRAAQDSTVEITLRSEPHDQSSWASLPGSMPRLEPKALLQVTAPLDIGEASILDVTNAIATG